MPIEWKAGSFSTYLRRGRKRLYPVVGWVGGEFGIHKQRGAIPDLGRRTIFHLILVGTGLRLATAETLDDIMALANIILPCANWPTVTADFAKTKAGQRCRAKIGAALTADGWGYLIGSRVLAKPGIVESPRHRELAA